MNNTHDKGLLAPDKDMKYIESEMRKYKVPGIYKLVFGFLYKWGNIFMPTLFTIITILVAIHAAGIMDLWNVIKCFAFFWIFLIGGAVSIAAIAHNLKVRKWCRRLGITVKQWNVFAALFDITYVDNE